MTGEKMTGELQPLLKTESLGRSHLHVVVCASTQDVALDLVRAGTPHGTLVTCDEQVSGRGRMGRTWLSGRGSIAFSVVLSQQIEATRAPQLSLVSGLGIAQALQRLHIPALLKWPNDIWVNEKKAGGILCSLETTPLAVVVGVGLNLTFDAGALDPSLTARAGKMESLAAIPRATLLSELLLGVEQAFLAYQSGTSLHQPLNDMLALKGQKVQVHTPHGMVEGSVAGVNHDFSLQLHTEAGPRMIDVGEVWPIESGSMR